MHIRSIRLRGLPPIEDVYLECNERVNLLIGPNASGTSTILRAIERLLSEGDKNTWSTYAFIVIDDEGHPVQVSEEKLEELGELEDQLEVAKEEDSDQLDGLEDLLSNYDYPVRVEVHPSWDWPRDSSGLDRINWGAMPPLLYIPATRLNLPGMHVFNHRIDRMEDSPADAPMERLFDTVSGTFNGQYVDQAIQWLRQNFRHNRARQNQLTKAIEAGYACAKIICPEVIRDNAPHPYIEVRDEEDTESYVKEGIVHYNLGIGTTDDVSAEPLYAGALSSGTQSTLLWIYALALKMAYHYHWEEGWQKKPAILLIDEIENHLHPTWQRRVIPALLKHFPKLQIFATTHSPFVVAGLKAGQVHLLKRDEKSSRVTATTHDKDIVGWTMDEILRTMMDVEDPTDKDTAEAAQELRQLRNEWPRSSPEDEAKRQERIAELRQKVDRDLLAGGPLAAQREEFAKRFAEALEKHGIPKNLNLENG